jgi:molybdate transport system permease protein
MGMIFPMTDSNFALSADDLNALWLTVKLATTVTLILLIIGTPLALWLSKKQSKLRSVINALVALPLVLPPTVLGFYLLLAFSPDSPLGKLINVMNLGTLAFSFTGLVIASVLYSLPFVVQPIQNAFRAIGTRPAEVAATLGAGPWARFIYITLPLARPGFITAAVLGFAHTVGEFGVVLMIGGNIPGETKVASVQIYDHVEALAYSQAHVLSAVLLTFSFIVLLLVYGRKQHKSGANSWQ